MKKNYDLIIANLSWNEYKWEKPSMDPYTNHKYIKAYPGHESLNFKFDKKVDTNKIIYGYIEIGGRKIKSFNNGGIFVFYSNNAKENKGQIIGIYEGVEVLQNTIKMYCSKFENNSIYFNIKANKKLSFIFPIYLDANKYKTNKKRLVGQIGFQYYELDILKRILTDELLELEKDNSKYKNEIAKLKSIYKKYFDDNAYDELEQNIILQYLTNTELIDDNVIEKSFTTKGFKRDNYLISKIKVERGFKCQICGFTMKKRDGSFYIEAAHIIAKKSKGTENRNNILLLCPNHHKEFDLGDTKIIKHTNEYIKLSINKIEKTIIF